MLPKAYDPKGTESRIYKMWEESGAFKAHAGSKKEHFSIAMPPPNATGQLHLGHAVMLALEDIFIRFARMQGKEALWVPGTDHAAIATENVVLKMLREQGIADPRKTLGREKLLAAIADYVERSRLTIQTQIRKMGSSCDWSRERYTYEPALNRIVNEVFKKMYGDGLIYRGHRIVNWDPKMQTTVSDDEIAYVEEQAPFYTFWYGPFQIGTSRPETKFGDKYVVMHPEDTRYKTYKHGETFACEWINGSVRATIIKDTAVDPEFGTGVMTITPWHDAVDFEIAERHGLEKEQIIGFDGKLLPIAGAFAGMRIEEARPLIVEKLAKKGLLVMTDEHYIHNKAVSQRGKGPIEPQIKLQWFIDVNKKFDQWKGPWEGKTMSLKEVMHDVVHHGRIQIIPDRFNKVYFHWIDNLRDWCISRQIWWGHRVPVYYCSRCERQALSSEQKNLTAHSSQLTARGRGGIFLSVHLLDRCPECGGAVQKDPDTLDTWFSSALWTWSTLIDPALTEDASLSLEDMLGRSPDVQKFHPTTVMETGYDILFFWVARMILMTTYAVGQIPFKVVYLHGLIRTREGKKMSKSDPETMIDPVDMITTYGADALRLSMIVGQSPGADSRLYAEKIAGYRNFINKLWNASRFVLMQCEEAKVEPAKITKLPDPSALSLADRAVLHGLEELIEDVTKGIEAYRLSEVGERLYSFTWDYFCDWYLELSKGQANTDVLVHTVRRLLKLLHPYCPFVTEELWAAVKPKDAGMLIAEEWPALHPQRKDPEAFAQLQLVIDFIRTLREHKLKFHYPDGGNVHVTVDAATMELFHAQEEHIKRMAKVNGIYPPGAWAGGPRPPRFVHSAFQGHILANRGYDPEEERATLTKESDALQTYIGKLEGELANEQFVARAPKNVVEEKRANLDTAKQKLRALQERLRAMEE